MKFPSFLYLLEHVSQSFKRFYLPIMIAAIGTSCAVELAELRDAHITLQKILEVCFIGVPFTLGCCLFVEQLPNRSLRLPLLFVACILLVVYFVYLSPGILFDNSKEWIIFCVLIILSHLWVSFAAFTRSNSQIAFWRLNEIFFTRIIIAVIYSGVLYAGLSLALFALDRLLNVKIRSTLYLDLWCVVAGLFNTWFFLAGIPKDYEPLKLINKFPVWLKVFAQYILIPIITIYLIILYT